MSETDRDLLDAYLRGSVAAFEALVSRYEEPLLRYAERLLGDGSIAQDVVQETYLRLIREGRRVRARDDLATWLYRVCRNASLDAVRKEARMRKTHEQAAAGRPPFAPAGDPVESQEAQTAVRRELDNLPANQREVLVLRVQQRKSYHEISAITGLTEGNIGYLVHHGLRGLAQRLKAAGVI